MNSIRKLKMTPDQYEHLFTELSRRGGGFRESGAFMLAENSPLEDPKQTDYLTISTFAFYDDLDPNSLPGNIVFRAVGYSALGALCRSQNLRVVGDIHTHPGSWVHQSSIDASNPMAARNGHVAIIAPHYGRGHIESTELGIHVFLGSGTWNSYFDDDVNEILSIANAALSQNASRKPIRRILNLFKNLGVNYKRRRIG